MKKNIGKTTSYLRPIATDHADEIRFESYYCSEKRFGRNEHLVEISIGNDGTMWISEHGSEAFMYLYPEQVEHLKKILNKRTPSKRKKP